MGKRAPNAAANSVAQFLGATYAEKPDLWAEATPLTHVDKNSAAFLFLHGTADTTVPYRQSVDMMNKLKAAGVEAELFTAEGAAHGFFNRPPWFEPALAKMEEFFVRRLLKP
jgi:pectinesterase